MLYPCVSMGKWSFQDVQLDCWTDHRNNNLQITFCSWAPRGITCFCNRKLGNWEVIPSRQRRIRKEWFGNKYFSFGLSPVHGAFCAPAEWRDGPLSHQEQPGKVSLKWVFTKQSLFLSYFSLALFVFHSSANYSERKPFFRGYRHRPQIRPTVIINMVHDLK